MSGRYITKAELNKRLRQVKRRNPNATEWEVLEIFRQEQDEAKKPHPDTKTISTTLQRLGLGVNRGLYMETPLGVKDGKVTFQWGRLIQYRGSTKSGSALNVAADEFVLNPHRFLEQFRSYRTSSLGEYSRRCQGCGNAFVSTRSDAVCCSAKCRKRVSRKKCHT